MLGRRSGAGLPHIWLPSVVPSAEQVAEQLTPGSALAASGSDARQVVVDGPVRSTA